MREIVWREKARRDLHKIVDYIAKRNPFAARRLLSRIEEAILPLRAHPELFRAGRVNGTRELVAHANYIVVYRVTATTTRSSASCMHAGVILNPWSELAVR